MATGRESRQAQHADEHVAILEAAAAHTTEAADAAAEAARTAAAAADAASAAAAAAKEATDTLREGLPPAPPAPSPKPPHGLAVFYALALLAFVIGAAVVQTRDVDTPIKAAVWAMAATAIVWLVMPFIWGRAAPDNDPTPFLRDGANVLITVDGVVLGLIYAFVGDKNPVPPVVKVGAVSLVAGAILALTLYSLATGRITTSRSVHIGNGVYSLAAWAMAFGLWCIAFGLIYR